MTDPLSTEPLSTTLARWVVGLRYDDLPPDVVHATKLRVMDSIGLALAGAGTDFGRSVLDAEVALAAEGRCCVFGTGERLAPGSAAFVNGARVQALEFDDTHNESIVHMSGPAVASAFALAEHQPVSGRAAITAIALGNEISCRVGSVAVGQFHKRGFHPTGLFAPFGVTFLAGQLMGLGAEALARGAGIAGSFASGLLECWVDGTQSKFLHSGWAARAGLAAASLARAGTTGPARVFEGRFGLFASHVQDPSARPDFGRIRENLGTDWESRRASFKPFPAAHVLHPYVSAVLRLRDAHGIDPADVESIDCPVAAFNVPIVCEPTTEKWAPASDSHGRVSLQFTVAEALVRGRLGKDAYAAASLRDPGILGLARRVRYHHDPDFDGLAHFRGAVTITLRDGRTLHEVEEYNRGSAQNPMTEAELRAKFDENAGALLPAAARDRLCDAVMRLDTLPEAGSLPGLTVP
ncbi:MAG: MmgE/PrpD family protein [Acidobacteria bacterium]|nr:MmgE/PrpD family protein [Acidobacteriota bacterium]